MKTSISGHPAWKDKEEEDKPIVIEAENKYSKPYTLRKDLCQMVQKFGYELQSVIDSIVNNTPSHQATTYYLLEKDHECIC